MATNKRDRKNFPIVGIGASAGGLETFSELLNNLPADTNMAFVYIQHLAPERPSILNELLAKSTKMPVNEAADGMEVEPNHIYIIPPSTDLAIFHGQLNLMPRTVVKGQHMPIDYFFRSLAEDQANKAIGIILSGTASDGAQGLLEIKNEGGITFVQDPRTAKYDGMPRAAIAADDIDYILSPEEISKELAKIGRHPYARHPKAEETAELLPKKEGELLNKIFLLLRSATGADFTFYKRPTVNRRIVRRMVINKIENLQQYVRLLQKSPEEIEALHNDMLINVTSFFRDPAAFAALKSKVFPNIIKNLGPSEPIRIWAPGCSTGEEAYSVAITLLEFLQGKKTKPPILIFASDINEKTIQKARAGIYPESINANVDEQRLSRFFYKSNGGYRINDMIREMCIFAKHDIIRDPPFSKIDLITFRNVLIYMDSILQRRLIPILHYALKPHGFLFLGPSETVSGFSELFSVVDKKNKIYSKKRAARPEFEFAPAPYPLQKIEAVRPRRVEEAPKEFDVQKAADRIILSQYAPPSVLINEEMEILHFRGHTGPFLEPAPGKASLNLLKMVKNGLSLEIRPAVYKAKQTNGPVRKEGLEVIPIKGSHNEYYFLVSFEDVTSKAVPKVGKAAKEEKPAKAGAAEMEINRLMKELTETKETLRSIVHEREAANEELRASNEEIQSSNEELQSINEELETSKEELQSANEELTTVNDELQNRNVELREARDYADSIINTIREPLLVLDSNFRVVTANPSFYRTFKVSAQGTENQVLYDLGNSQWDIAALRKLMVEILPQKTWLADFEVEHDFEQIGHKTMLLNARQIVQEGQGRELILLAIEDITERKEDQKNKEQLIKQKAIEEAFKVREKLSNALNKINQSINSTLDFHKIIQAALTDAGKALGINSAGILLVEDNYLSLKYVYRLPKEIIGTNFEKEYLSDMLDQLVKGKPVVIKDAFDKEQIPKQIIKKFNVRSVLIVPLLVRKTLIGIIAFNYEQINEFSKAQVDFATKLSTNVSLAMENARLYEAEHNVAETLQEAILAVPSKIAGVDFSHLYQSAAEESRVGGDFYDIFELDNDQVGFLVGDVAGKGLEAAGLASTVNNIIKAYAYQGTNTSLIMKNTSEVITKTTVLGMFITAFLLILNKKTGDFIYCNAGHPPPVFKSKGLKSSLINSGSPVIGIKTEQTFINGKGRLEKDEALILYTDGLTEARRNKDFFGEKRLLSIVKKLEPQSAKKLTNAIFNEVNDFCSGKFSDDLVILTIKLS